MWLGFDANARIWLNGKQVFKGVYWSTCQFYGRRMVDQIASAISLRKGWNEFVMQVTGRQQGPDWQTGIQLEGTWGFSVRFCDIKNKAVPGMRWQSTAPQGFAVPREKTINPQSPRTYKWSDMSDDYTALRPELKLTDLRAITGYSTLTATNDIFFGFQAAPKGGLPETWMSQSPDPKAIRLQPAPLVLFTKGALRRLALPARRKATGPAVHPS